MTSQKKTLKKKPARKKAPSKKPARKKLAAKKGVRKKKNEKVQRELSAGGIVFRVVRGRVSFALMKDSYDKWTFPKGHVEKGEDLEQAAARETLEEMGLEQIRLLEYLGKIDIWFRDKYQKKGQLIHKDIHYFLFEAPANAQLFPDPEEHVYEAKWVPMSKVEKTSSYNDMVPIVKRAMEIVKEMMEK